MAQGRFGVLAEVMPPLDRRLRNFVKEALDSTIDVPVLRELGVKHGILNEILCTEENREVWQHLPVEAGDRIYQIVEGVAG